MRPISPKCPIVCQAASRRSVTATSATVGDVGKHMDRKTDRRETGKSARDETAGIERAKVATSATGHTAGRRKMERSGSRSLACVSAANNPSYPSLLVDFQRH